MAKLPMFVRTAFREIPDNPRQIAVDMSIGYGDDPDDPGMTWGEPEQIDLLEYVGELDETFEELKRELLESVIKPPGA